MVPRWRGGSESALLTSAAGAFHAEGGHQSDGLDFGAWSLGTTGAGDFGRVEIRWVVLGKDFSFRHGGSGDEFGAE